MGNKGRAASKKKQQQISQLLSGTSCKKRKRLCIQKSIHLKENSDVREGDKPVSINYFRITGKYS